MKAKLGVGVVGVGEMGRRHAYNLRTLIPDARLIAVADPAENRAREVAADLEVDRWFNSLEAMLECEEIQAIVISSPDKYHAKAIEASARAGRAILCEKPIATAVSEAEAALKAVADAAVPLQIGFMRRYDPAYQAAYARIESGEIGEPVIFKSVGRDKDAPPLSAYRSGSNGMVFYNSTIHDFDLARWMMLDEIDQVQAYSTVNIRPEIAQYGDVVASVINLKFDHGAIGNVESYVQAEYGYDVRTEVVGSKGAVFVGSIQKAPAMIATAQGGTRALEDHYLSRFADAYIAELTDFVSNVLHERPIRVPGEIGFRALQIAAASERSHLSGRSEKVTR